MSETLWQTPTLVASVGVDFELKAKAGGADLGLMFENFHVALEGEGVSADASAFVSFVTPFHRGESVNLLGFSNLLTYNVDKTRGARVLLLVDVAGSTHSMEFPLDTVEGTGLPNTDPLPSMPTTAFFTPSLLYPNLPETLPSTCSISICILLRRRTPEDYAVVRIDSLDITMV
jgi:hypothetical protein